MDDDKNLLILVSESEDENIYSKYVRKENKDGDCYKEPGKQESEFVDTV